MIRKEEKGAVPGNNLPCCPTQGRQGCRRLLGAPLQVEMCCAGIWEKQEKWSLDTEHQPAEHSNDSKNVKNIRSLSFHAV
jgi:hypothetical protein